MDTQANEANESMGQSLGVGSAKRPRNWSEIGLEEKVERLRDLVKSLALTNSRLTRELNEAKGLIWDHTHQEDGETFVKVLKKDRWSLERSGSLDAQIGKTLTQKERDEAYI